MQEPKCGPILIYNIHHPGKPYHVITSNDEDAAAAAAEAVTFHPARSPDNQTKQTNLQKINK